MLAQNLGIKEQVIFAGIIRREHLEKIYVASDAFSMLSKFDTFGMAALEAMAASLPVTISSNVGAKTWSGKELTDTSLIMKPARMTLLIK